MSVFMTGHLTAFGLGYTSRMKTPFRSLPIVFALAVTACSSASPERQAVLDAAEAMGGRAKVLAVKTLTMEGEGDAPNVGQNTMPDSELPNWHVTEFKRTI